jgi:hypothetical protein
MASALVALVAGLLPAPTSAEVPGVCAVIATEVPGLSAEEVREALAVERRKAGLQMSWDLAPGIPDCPTAAASSRLVVEVLGGALVTLLPASGTSFRMDFSSVSQGDRAGMLARRVVGILSTPALSRRADLVDELVVSRLPGVATGAPRSGKRGIAAGGYIHAGGMGGWQLGPDRGAGAIDVEAGAVMLGRQLWVGVRAGWEPPHEAGRSIGARAQAVAVLAQVRWAFPAGPIAVRAGIGTGIGWRRVTLSPPAYELPVSHVGLALVLDAELEVVVPVTRWLSLAFGPSLRGVPAWTDLEWDGKPACRASRIQVGAVMRLLGVFGEAAR